MFSENSEIPIQPLHKRNYKDTPKRFNLLYLKIHKKPPLPFTDHRERPKLSLCKYHKMKQVLKYDGFSAVVSFTKCYYMMEF